MKVRNKSFSPRELLLTDVRALTLPARGSVGIGNGDFASPACQRLFAERLLIVLPAPRRPAPGAPPSPRYDLARRGSRRHGTDSVRVHQQWPFV